MGVNVIYTNSRKILWLFQNRGLNIVTKIGISLAYSGDTEKVKYFCLILQSFQLRRRDDAALDLSDQPP